MALSLVSISRVQESIAVLCIFLQNNIYIYIYIYIYMCER